MFTFKHVFAPLLMPSASLAGIFKQTLGPEHRSLVLLQNELPVGWSYFAPHDSLEGHFEVINMVKAH